jgi:uncharacterized membrane protein
MSDPGTPDGTAGDPAAHGQLDTSRYSATSAISYGWRKFWASPGTLLVPMIVVFVGLVVAALIVDFVVVGGFFGKTECSAGVNPGGQVSTDCGQPFWRQLLGAGLGAAIISVITQILAAGLYRGATRVADGKDFSLGQLFEGYSKLQVVYAAIIIAFVTGVATILCYLPGVLISFFTSFTLFFIADEHEDRQLEAAEAIGASVKLVWHNFGHMLVFFILAAVVLVIGALLCGVGLLVAGPVVLLGAAYTYRRLQGEAVVR